MEGFADGGMPQDYSAMVMQALFGGVNPSAGAYGMAGGSPGGMGFVPPPNMQVTGLKPAEAPPVKDRTSAKDVADAAKASYDMYNSEEGQKALGYAKDFLGFMSPAPSQARGGRTGYAMGGSPYSEDPIMGAAPGLAPTPSFVPPPDQQNTGKGLKAPEAPSAPPSDGLGKVADIAKIAATIIPFFLKDGGVAGPRRGYDAGGAPQEQGWGDWLDSMLPMNGPMADPAHRQQELQQSAPAPAAAPSANMPQDTTEALNQAQKDAQKAVDQTWAESQDPHMGRIQSGLKMGQAALEKGLGVYLPGMVNWASGDPTRANGIGGAPANAPAPTAAPAAPASSVVPSAAAATRGWICAPTGAATSSSSRSTRTRISRPMWAPHARPRRRV
jgi:hypothetical protein